MYLCFSRLALKQEFEDSLYRRGVHMWQQSKKTSEDFYIRCSNNNNAETAIKKMSDKVSLYSLVRKLISLETLHEQQQQLRRNESRAKLLTMMLDISQTLESIAAVPIDCFDNKLREGETNEPYLKIQRENAHYLRDIKNKIMELFIEVKQATDMKIPDNLEKCLADFSADIHEKKLQLQASTSVAKNLDCILKQDTLIQLDTANTNVTLNSEEKENTPFINF